MTEIDLSRAEWHENSYSSQSGNCVEVARNLPDLVAIRDSKAPEGPKLLVPRLPGKPSYRPSALSTPRV